MCEREREGEAAGSEKLQINDKADIACGQTIASGAKAWKVRSEPGLALSFQGLCGEQPGQDREMLKDMSYKGR